MQPWSAAPLMKDYLAVVPGHLITAVTPDEMNVSLKIVSVAGHWGIMYNTLSHPSLVLPRESPNGILRGWKGRAIPSLNKTVTVHDIVYDGQFGSHYLQQSQLHCVISWCWVLIFRFIKTNWWKRRPVSEICSTRAWDHVINNSILWVPWLLAHGRNNKNNF